MDEKSKIILVNLAIIFLAYGYHFFICRIHLTALPFPPLWIFLFHLLLNIFLWFSIYILHYWPVVKPALILMGWGMMKILLAGIFILWLQLRFHWQGNIWFIIDFMGLYLIFLLDELWIGIRLIKNRF